MSISKKKKIASAVTAASLAAIVLLSGTYAWQSISQEAKNETSGNAMNPGGRLHDDFDGRNKDVYVENFTSEDEDGVPIFARIRLDEYMELGEDAGQNLDNPMRVATPLIAGANINDVTTWKTHIPTTETKVCENGEPNTFHEYWTWDMGGETVYMPTFNKNKDSLKADINGTYEGLDDIPYSDYVTYTEGYTKTGKAVYDNDLNNTEDENVTTATESHTARKTQNATVMTMQEWIDGGRQTGKFWVYDVDGWAYWAEAIQPGEATGLLLDRIDLESEPMENWYYAINVVAQFATAGDWGAEDGTGFYDISKGVPPTSNALFLLNQAAGKAPTVTITEADNKNTVSPGESLTFTAKLTLADIEVDNQNVTWTVEGATSTDTAINDGVLLVGADETADVLTVKATSVGYEKSIGRYEVAVINP
ncbi:MAG: hypothetical protein ACI4M3_05025 [Acutalibacteraceae bacterium]